MNRTIKFRGREFFSKRHVFGQTIRETEDGFDFWTGDDWLHCTNVAQLIGVDKDGNEVYEGDRVIRVEPNSETDDFDDEKTFPMHATFEDFAAIADGQIVLLPASQAKE